MAEGSKLSIPRSAVNLVTKIKIIKFFKNMLTKQTNENMLTKKYEGERD